MNIKGKLYMIMAVTVIGILAIGGSSLIGMNFVKGKLNVLTEHSTPYQLKTIDLQRAIQEHTSGLIKLAAVQTGAEFGAIKTEIDKSMATVTGLSKDLSSFTGSGSTSGTEQLAAITKDMISVTESRLKAEETGRSADQLMKQKLLLISQKLRLLDSSMRKTQGASMTELSASNSGVKQINQRLQQVQAASTIINELRTSILELSSADNRNALTVATSKFTMASRKLVGCDFCKNEAAMAKPILDGNADINSRVRGADGLLNAKKHLLTSEPDDDMRKQFSANLASVMQKISQMTVVMGDVVEKANDEYAKEDSRFDNSLRGAGSASSILGVSSELIAEGSEISRLIRDIFTVNNTKELDDIKTAMNSAFARAAALQSKVSGNKNVKDSGASAVAGVVASLNEVRGLLLAKDGVADAISSLLAVKKQAADLSAKLRELVNAQREEGKKGMTSAQAEQEKAVKSVNQVFRNNILTVSILGLAVLIVGVLLSSMVLRSISRPITDLSQMAERFGSGDFSGRLDDKRKDEFGALAVNFNAATAKLAEITQGLRRAICDLNSGARELATASTDLSTGAARQSSESTQAASAMTEMSQTIDDVARNAHTAATESSNALSRATTGREVVVRTVTGMELIAASVRDAAEVIEALGGSSARIGDIISSINDIADQTNLLALNAAIEAARAGDAGRGFAVVADEVRKLAQQTAEATREIADTIGQIQKDTERSVQAMRQGTERVEEGITLAHEANQSLSAIVEASNQSVTVVNQIAVATEEQSIVAGQVSRGVEQIAEITRDAEHSADKISRAAANLNELASELDRMAAWFKV